MLKTILLIFLIFFLLRLVAPTLLRLLITFVVGRQVRKGNFSPFQQHRPGYQRPADVPPGKIRVEKPASDPDKKGFDGGEYVDYEEVK
jgi:hypothetical protein